MAFALLALGAVGHVTLWVSLVSRFHALGVERKWVDLLTVLCGIMLFAVPLVLASAFPSVFGPWITLPVMIAPVVAWCYIVVCAGVCVVAVVQRCVWHQHLERRGALLDNHTTREILTGSPGKSLTEPGIHTWLCRLPGNEALRVCVRERRVAIPRLSHAAGLRIVHLTDLHMSGRIGKSYFEQVVAAANECDPDLIAVTGDLVERNKCLDWIPDTLGKLRAPGGVYFVLGNHDRHVDHGRLMAALAAAGLVYLGGRWIELTFRSVPLILGGNELPWYKPAANLNTCPAHDSAGLPLRIILAHTPDQFAWAQANDVDLMLAGHLHGGQVRFPLLGPIVAPSWHGVRYAAGVFAAGRTVMHVSCGTGSLTPLRYNCPPEIAVLTLCAAGGRS